MDRIKFDKACVQLFKSMVPQTEKPEALKELDLTEFFLLQGIVVDPALRYNLQEEVVGAINWYYGKDAFNLNQTFHKDLETVAKISPEQHYFQQFLHYLTTYGFEALNIEDDYVYIPNEKLELPEDTVPIKPVKISAITVSEVEERTMKMLSSGIALKGETIDALLEIIKYLDLQVSLDEIKNKEARCIIAYERRLPVKTSDDVLRVLGKIVMGDAMIVRSIRDMKKIKLYMTYSAAIEEVYEYLKIIPVETIAKDFNKNRNLWFGYRGEMTGRKDDDEKLMYIRTKINQASRLNLKREKVPVKEKLTLDSFYKFLNADPGAALYEILADDAKLINQEENIFKLIKFMNYLRERIKNPDYKVYRIRNSKSYVLDNENVSQSTHVVITCQEVEKVVRQRIIDLLSSKLADKKVYIPSNIEYALPTSEKQFIQGVPEGSRYLFNKHAIIAVHWTNPLIDNQEIRVDLDLKAMGIDTVIGWDARFREKTDIMFSGDITDAKRPNGATEAIYFDRSVSEPFTIGLNNFNNSVECPLELIFEDTDADKYNNFKSSKDSGHNGIIDNKVANKLISCAKKDDARQKSLGIYINNKFYFSDTSIGVGSTMVKTEYMDKYLHGIADKYNSGLTLNELLDNLGCLVEKPEEADLDLSLEKITADTFIDLFTIEKE